MLPCAGPSLSPTARLLAAIALVVSRCLDVPSTISTCGCVRCVKKPWPPRPPNRLCLQSSFVPPNARAHTNTAACVEFWPLSFTHPARLARGVHTPANAAHTSANARLFQQPPCTSPPGVAASVAERSALTTTAFDDLTARVQAPVLQRSLPISTCRTTRPPPSSSAPFHPKPPPKP